MADPIINLGTLGIKVVYATEATAGTRPTTGYTEIPCITSTPELNPTPESIDVTDLSQTEYKQSIPGLKDLGGALSFGVNINEALIAAWDKLCTDADNAKKTNKRVWFAIIHPNLTKCVSFAGEPTTLGMPAAEVNGALQGNVSVTPTNAPEWVAKPTIGGSSAS